MGTFDCHSERSYLSSRAECNVPSGYGDLGCSGRPKRKARLLRRLSCYREALSVIARYEAISLFFFVIASGTQCALWVWRSRLFGVGGQSKERLLRRLAMTVGVARNETISVVRAGEQKREIASQARNPQRGL